MAYTTEQQHFVLRNQRAGELLRDLRREQGLSPEALSYAIFKAGYGAVSARTIRRCEAIGMIPRIRAQFALATFFGRTVPSVWDDGANRKVVVRDAA